LYSILLQIDRFQALPITHVSYVTGDRIKFEETTLDISY